MEFRMSLKTASSSRRVHTSSVCPPRALAPGTGLALAVPSVQPSRRTGLDSSSNPSFILSLIVWEDTASHWCDRHTTGCSAELELGEVPSHHLCSQERSIPAAPTAASQGHRPTQDPSGKRPLPPARASPPRVAKAELGPPHWVTPSPGGLSCSPS